MAALKLLRFLSVKHYQLLLGSNIGACIVIVALFPSISYSQDHASYAEGKVFIPSLTVGAEIYTNLILNHEQDLVFSVEGYGGKTLETYPTVSRFSNNELFIKILEHEGQIYSNLRFAYEEDSKLYFYSSNTPSPIYGTSLENRHHNPWVDYVGIRDEGVKAFNNITYGQGENTIPLVSTYLDIDLDGDLDIFFGTIHYGQPYILENVKRVPAEVYINEGNGIYRYDISMFTNGPPTLVHPRKAIVADFNGDNLPDIFVVDHGFDKSPFPGEQPWIVLSNIDGTYTSTQLLSQHFFHGAAAGDIDNDGDVDVYTSPGIAFLNNGSGDFSIVDDYLGVTGNGVYTIEIFDLDADGYNDIITSGHTWDTPTSIYFGDVNGVHRNSSVISIPAGDESEAIVIDILVTDLNTDGIYELVLSSTSGPDPFYNGAAIQVIELDADGSFLKRTTVYSDEDTNWIPWIRVQDIDGDGDLDIVDDNRANEFFLRNDGFGNLRKP